MQSRWNNFKQQGATRLGISPTANVPCSLFFSNKWDIYPQNPFLISFNCSSMTFLLILFFMNRFFFQFDFFNLYFSMNSFKLFFIVFLPISDYYFYRKDHNGLFRLNVLCIPSSVCKNDRYFDGC